MCILVLPISIIVLPLPRITRFKIASPLWKLFFKTIVRITTLGNLYCEDRRDKKYSEKISPPGLYIANHQSFMDIPLIFSYLVIAPIMKKSLIYIPIFGLCAYASGAILVNRGKKSSRKKVLKAAMNRLLVGEKNLMYYPEGSRNRADGIPRDFKDIKTPMMKYAYDNNIVIFPVSMFGTNKMIQKNMINYGTQVGIILHSGVDPENFDNKDDFLEAAWNKVQSGHSELTEKLASE